MASARGRVGDSILVKLVENWMSRDRFVVCLDEMSMSNLSQMPGGRIVYDVGQRCREERSLAKGVNVQIEVASEAPTVTTALLYTSA